MPISGQRIKKIEFSRHSGFCLDYSYFGINYLIKCSSTKQTLYRLFVKIASYPLLHSWFSFCLNEVVKVINICHAVNLLLTKRTGTVTEYHSEAIQSIFGYLPVTYQLTKWHSFILWCLITIIRPYSLKP